MARMKPLRPFEILAIVLAVPSLVLGAIVLAMEIWPPPGPGENGMAIVILCGIGSIVFFVLFMIVAAAARLRWRVFTAIAGVWVAMAVVMYVTEQWQMSRFDEVRNITMRRVDTLDSSLMRPMYFVRSEKERAKMFASGMDESESERILIVDEAALACMKERIGRSGGEASADDALVLDITVVCEGMMTGGGVSRSRVAAFLGDMGMCLDAGARERLSQFRAEIERSEAPDTEKK